MRRHAVIEYLSQLGNPIAQQHRAIVYLLADDPINRVYELVTNPDRAADEILDAIDAAAVERAAAILTACPAVQNHPPGLLAIAALLADEDMDQAREAITACRELSNPRQLRAWAVHLERFRRSLLQKDSGRNVSNLDELIAILTAPASGEN